MKKISSLFIILSILSCESKEQKKEKFLKDIQEQAKEMKKNQIDLFLDAKPKYFSAKTINGTTFNSQNYKGKNLVIFIYDKSYLKKSDTYDMPEEFNSLYKEFKNNVGFIGIVEGFIENEKELKDHLNQSNILFEQIDNTKSYDKSEKLNYNIFCSPAKILIDINGKVIHSSCGGGNTTEISRKLDSIKVASK
ncbi:Alkyl hydroperoxide reductase subunit AhpC (peroxiredoxin) [Chryseobacterium soldanellicola]|uniref:Alkyl hydroperoxide reductase subunit AhpC (Peroxiredoxin) n=1 Tax=Chryseobacterium soldanellicola TaxID=311333 RepID=A0A1H1DUT0_9FLAO|nr:redoxin domain-containing protein [Chryseobacterium soldanellicola]SDQ80312.1 Alkyl hydroperoxide reductase subunit AhpC (peroxiredoxin) [Chryseobacterium soldanellicola]